MQKTKLMLKRLKNDRLILSLALAFFLLAPGYIAVRSLLLHLSAASPLSYLSASLDTSMIAFIFFMFLSYEYLCRIKQQSVEEMLKASSGGLKSFYLTGLSILAFLLGAYALAVFSINVVIYFCLGVGKSEYLVHIVLNVFLNIFLVPLVGILFGAAVSFSRRRIGAYIAMLAAAFLSTPMFTAITDAVYEGTGKNLTLLRGIFDIFPQSLGYTPIYAFGYSLLPYRWDIVSFWLCLFAAVLILRLAGSKRIRGFFAAFTCIVLAIVSMLGYVKPASKPVLRGNADSSGIADMDYYFSAVQRNKRADFAVEKYDLFLRIDRRLSCEATLTLSKENLSVYNFTLYHGFKVESARSDCGKSLQFEQNGDYISVRRADEPLKRITLEYSGSAPRFFSNSQSTSLPGWFPYYPHAGEREIYDRSIFGFNRILCPDNTEFKLDINCKNNVFCSLDKTESGYAGKSSGVTIVSGFYDTFMYGNIQVMYPFLDTAEYSEKSIRENLDEYTAQGIIDTSSKKLIVISNVNMTSVYERYCRFSDHTAVAQLSGLADFYETQKVPSYKLSLYNAFSYYQSDRESWKQLIDSTKEFYAGDEELIQNDAKVMLQRTLDEVGESYAEKQISEYLNDDYDTRNWKSFFEDLRGEKQ